MSLDDFKDVEIKILDQIEKEFENQPIRSLFLSLLTWQIFISRFSFIFSKGSGSNLIEMASHFMYV